MSPSSGDILEREERSDKQVRPEILALGEFFKDSIRFLSSLLFWKTPAVQAAVAEDQPQDTADEEDSKTDSLTESWAEEMFGDFLKSAVKPIGEILELEHAYNSLISSEGDPSDDQPHSDATVIFMGAQAGGEDPSAIHVGPLAPIDSDDEDRTESAHPSGNSASSGAEDGLGFSEHGGSHGSGDSDGSGGIGDGGSGDGGAGAAADGGASGSDGGTGGSGGTGGGDAGGGTGGTGGTGDGGAGGGTGGSGNGDGGVGDGNGNSGGAGGGTGGTGGTGDGGAGGGTGGTGGTGDGGAGGGTGGTGGTGDGGAGGGTGGTGGAGDGGAGGGTGSGGTGGSGNGDGGVGTGNGNGNGKGNGNGNGGGNGSGGAGGAGGVTVDGGAGAGSGGAVGAGDGQGDPTDSNTAPIAENDEFAIDEGAILTGDVLGDNGAGADFDPDGDALTVSLISGPEDGQLTLNADGTFDYEASADAFDAAAPGDVIEQNFVYQIDDGQGGTAQATATIFVTAVEDGVEIIGGAESDNLTGAGGDDVIYGENGDDVLEGLGGDDILDGGRGDDTLFGGDGADILVGGQGDDILIGELGDDELTGGSGLDTFVLEIGEGVDTILDFDTNHDQLGLVDLGFDDVVIEQDGLDAVVSTTDGDVLAILNNVDATELNETNVVSLN